MVFLKEIFFAWGGVLAVVILHELGVDISTFPYWVHILIVLRATGFSPTQLAALRSFVRAVLLFLDREE